MVLFESLSYSILCEHSVMKRNLVFSISGCIKYDRGYECITCVSMWCNVFLVPMFYRDLKVMTSVIISLCRSRGKAMLDIFFSNFEMKMSCDLNKQFSIL